MISESDDLPDIENLEEEIEAELANEAGITLTTIVKPLGSPPRPKLKRKDWDECVALYESGRFTIAEIAGRFDMEVAVLKRRFKAANIRKGERALETNSEKPTQSSADEIKSTRIAETKEQHYQYADALSKLTMDVVVTAKRGSQRFATIEKDITALGKAAKTLEILRKERYAILDLDNADGADGLDLPELIVSELTQDQLSDIRKSVELELDEVDEELEEAIEYDGANETEI